MKKTGIFYSFSTQKTAKIAQQIKDNFGEVYICGFDINNQAIEKAKVLREKFPTLKWSLFLLQMLYSVKLRDHLMIVNIEL